MEVLQYQGRRVYTPWPIGVTTSDLGRAEVGSGRISDAYLFELMPDHEMKRIAFDPTKMSQRNIGLMVNARDGAAGAGISIAGSDSIDLFCQDFMCGLGDLGRLKETPVVVYRSHGAVTTWIGISAS